MEEVISELIKYQNRYKDLFCGDIWVDIPHSNFKRGLFCQIELDEDNLTDFWVYCYKNYIDDEGTLTIDYPTCEYLFKLDLENFEIK